MSLSHSYSKRYPNPLLQLSIANTTLHHFKLQQMKLLVTENKMFKNKNKTVQKPQ